MPHATALAFPAEDLIGWERAMYAFLVEKERRSGSRRTVEGYSRMLQDFFGRVGKPPDQVTAQEAFIWAHGKGLSGKDPSPVTIGARMACLSSFFRFLMGPETHHAKHHSRADDDGHQVGDKKQKRPACNPSLVSAQSIPHHRQRRDNCYRYGHAGDDRHTRAGAA